MSRKLNVGKHIRAWDKRDKAKEEYDHWNREYWDSFRDLQTYWEIVYRASSEYIKLTIGAYERIFNIKSHKIGKDEVVITGDSVEIFDGKCVFENNVTMKFPMTDDCELLYWSYEPHDKYRGEYDASDWVAFVSRGLRCKVIEQK